MSFSHSSQFESEYKPTYCEYEQCATLLAGHRIETNFIIEHINKFNLRIRVIWLGDTLWYAIHQIMNALDNEQIDNVKAFIVLHRTPSEVIDTDIEFQSVSMFPCDELAADNVTDNLCPYETTPIMKYCSTYFTNKFDLSIHRMSKIITISRDTEKRLLRMYNEHAHNWYDKIGKMKAAVHSIPHADNLGIFQKIACDYIKQNQSQYHRWIETVGKNLNHEIFLGTFYPNTGENEAEHIGRCRRKKSIATK